MTVARHNIRISVSLVGLTLFVFFLANWLGFVPDENEARLRARAELTEALAVQLSIAIQQNNLGAILPTVKAIVERNAHINSVSLNRADGSVVASHGKETLPGNTAHELPTLMKVPISKDGQPWGLLEVNYQPFQQEYLWGFINAAFLRLILFIALVSFIIYLILVGKVLRHLDPNKVIPGRVKRALNAVSDGIVLIDDQERVVLSNAALEKKLNYSADQLLSKNLSALPWVIENQKENGQRRLPWSQTLKDGKNRVHETLSYKISEDSRLTLIVNCTALQDAGERIRGALVSFYDVTEIEKMYEELDNMSKFLRHEMHNALIGAALTVSLLEQSDRLRDEDKKLLQRAKSSHRVINYLLESVREAKSIESSFKKEDTRPLRLDKLVEETVNNYSQIYNANPFEFTSDGAALTVFGQEERIIQMLDKLVTNAIDHSDAGTPIVFSCYKKAKYAFIKVANQGQPLPKDKKALFELFASFRNITATKHNQGIGLYVVKLIAEAYGGTVEAKDRKDVTGAEFIIRLPAV